MIDFTNADEMMVWFYHINAPVSCLYRGSRVTGDGRRVSFLDPLRRAQ